MAEIIDLSRTMPFFAEKRLIMIEDCGLFKAASEEMAEAVKMHRTRRFFCLWKVKSIKGTDCIRQLMMSDMCAK